MRFTVRVKKLMRLREISTEQAAAAFGVQPRTFQTWMRDGRRWKGEDIMTAVRTFRTSVGFLFGDTDNPDPVPPDGPQSGAGAIRA